MRSDGSIAAIEDVLRGLACDCVCFVCNMPMIARQGTVKKWSFAHAANTQIVCEWAAETALHYAMKEVIAEEKRMFVPQFDLKVERTTSYGEKVSKFVSVPGRLVRLDSVKLEHTINPIRPDVVATSGDKRIFIEVVVSHGVDDRKRGHIRRIGASAVAINLRNHQRTVDREMLRQVLLQPRPGTTWVFHRREEEYRAALLADVETIVAEKEQRHAERIATHFETKTSDWEFSRPPHPVVDNRPFSDGAVMCFRLRIGADAFIRRSPQQALVLELSEPTAIEPQLLLDLGIAATNEPCLWNLTDDSLWKVIPFLNALATSTTNRTRGQYMQHRYGE
jgi:hypothetical protein